jgi:hypothetical protein
MMPTRPKGAIYRCPVCGAELAVIGSRMGLFQPRCCDTDMVPLSRRRGGNCRGLRGRRSVRPPLLRHGHAGPRGMTDVNGDLL